MKLQSFLKYQGRFLRPKKGKLQQLEILLEIKALLPCQSYGQLKSLLLSASILFLKIVSRRFFLQHKIFPRIQQLKENNQFPAWKTEKEQQSLKPLFLRTKPNKSRMPARPSL